MGIIRYLIFLLILPGCSTFYHNHNSYYYGCINSLVMAYSYEIDDYHLYPSHEYMVRICENSEKHFIKSMTEEPLGENSER